MLLKFTHTQTPPTCEVVTFVLVVGQQHIQRPSLLQNSLPLSQFLDLTSVWKETYKLWEPAVY
jgi:hypothetical protein